MDCMYNVQYGFFKTSLCNFVGSLRRFLYIYASSKIYIQSELELIFFFSPTGHITDDNGKLRNPSLSLSTSPLFQTPRSESFQVSFLTQRLIDPVLKKKKVEGGGKKV